MLQKAVDLGSAAGTVHHTLAQIRLRQGQIQAAVELLKRGIEFEPHYSPSSALLAEVFARSGEGGRARRIAEEALVYNPGDSQLRQMLETLSDEKDK